MSTRIGPPPPTKSILKPSRLGGSISPLNTIIRTRSMPTNLPSNWREEGKDLRFEMLKGDIHNVFSITHSIPLENYLEIIHRVRVYFLLWNMNFITSIIDLINKFILVGSRKVQLLL